MSSYKHNLWFTSFTTPTCFIINPVYNQKLPKTPCSKDLWTLLYIHSMLAKCKFAMPVFPYRIHLLLLTFSLSNVSFINWLLGCTEYSVKAIGNQNATDFLYRLVPDCINKSQSMLVKHFNVTKNISYKYKEDGRYEKTLH